MHTGRSRTVVERVGDFLAAYDNPVLITTFGSAQRTPWALHVDEREDLRHSLGALLAVRLPQGLIQALKRGKALWAVLGLA